MNIKTCTKEEMLKKIARVKIMKIKKIARAMIAMAMIARVMRMGTTKKVKMRTMRVMKRIDKEKKMTVKETVTMKVGVKMTMMKEKHVYENSMK